MDAALQNALSARKSLEEQIQALNGRLTKINNFISLYDEFAQGRAPTEAAIPPVAMGGSGTMTVLLRKTSIVDQAVEILSDGYPRTTKVLLNLLSERGAKLSGKRPHINLSSMLSRDPRFLNERGKGWSLEHNPKTANPQDARTSQGLFINNVAARDPKPSR